MRRVVTIFTLIFGLAACGTSTNLTPQGDVRHLQVSQLGPGIDHWRRFDSFEGGPQPCAIIADRSGNVYYLTGTGVNKMNYSGTVTHLPGPPVNNGGVGQMAFGNDGNIWIAVGDVYRETPSGAITKITSGQTAQNVSAGAGSDIWYSADAIYHYLYATGTTTRYRLPVGETAAGALILGPDKNVWFLTSDAINKLNPTTGTITSFAKSGIGGFVGSYPGQNSDALAIGPDNNIWTLASNSGTMYKVSVAGSISGPFNVWRSGSIYPQIAVAGGSLWLNFAYIPDMAALSALIRVATDGTFTEEDPPNFYWASGGIPGGITTAADGNVWANTTDIGVRIINAIAATPYSFSFARPGLTANLSFAESGYTGSWSVGTTAPAVVKVSRIISATQVQITAVGPGSGRIIVRDTRYNYYSVPVSVK